MPTMDLRGFPLMVEGWNARIASDNRQEIGEIQGKADRRKGFEVIPFHGVMLWEVITL